MNIVILIATTFRSRAQKLWGLLADEWRVYVLQPARLCSFFPHNHSWNFSAVHDYYDIVWWAILIQDSNEVREISVMGKLVGYYVVSGYVIS